MDNDDPARTYFSNHAFVKVTDSGSGNETIVGACAGPAVGTLSLEDYIAGAIQPKRINLICGDNLLQPPSRHDHQGRSAPGTGRADQRHLALGSERARRVRFPRRSQGQRVDAQTAARPWTRPRPPTLTQPRMPSRSARYRSPSPSYWPTTTRGGDTSTSTSTPKASR